MSRRGRCRYKKKHKKGDPILAFIVISTSLFYMYPAIFSTLILVAVMIFDLWAIYYFALLPPNKKKNSNLVNAAYRYHNKEVKSGGSTKRDIGSLDKEWLNREEGIRKTTISFS